MGTAIIHVARNSGNRAGFYLLFVQLGSDGNSVTGEAKTVNLHVLRPTYEEVLKQGVTLSRNLPIAAGATKLRVIVRDATSGSIGSISIPLDKLFPNSG